VHALLGNPQIVQDRLGPLGQQPPGLGQPQPPAHPQEQRPAHHTLERPHLLADRGLAAVQFPRRRRERPGTDDGDERGQLTSIDHQIHPNALIGPPVELAC
jgi:hypothetical protein